MVAARLLTLVVRNACRQPLRSILTALTFSAAVFIYAALIAVPWTMDRIADHASKGLRLVVNERNDHRLPSRYCEEIRKMPHVVGCAPEIIWEAQYRDAKVPIFAYGVNSDIVTVSSNGDYQIPADKGRELQNDRRYALVGARLMHENGWKLGEPVTLRSYTDPRLALTFIPFIEYQSEYMSRAFLFDRRMFDDARKDLYGSDTSATASFLVVQVDSAANMGEAANRIDEHFRNSVAETDTAPESDTVANAVTAIGDIRPIVYCLCVVVLLTALLIAANSMAMMVRYRINEVALMRALGFTPAHVGILLLGEAALVGLCGALAGAGLALWCFGAGVTLGEVTGILGYMQVRPTTAAAAVAAAFAVSIASAALPVANAMRLAPAPGIRHVV